MNITSKPWGYEILLEHNEDYAVKILHVAPQQSLSLQLHTIKRESMYVLKGDGTIQLGTTARALGLGQIVTIEPGTKHRLLAGPRGIEVLEVSTPELDDLIRITDAYGRVDG